MFFMLILTLLLSLGWEGVGPFFPPLAAPVLLMKTSSFFLFLSSSNRRGDSFLFYCLAHTIVGFLLVFIAQLLAREIERASLPLFLS